MHQQMGAEKQNNLPGLCHLLPSWLTDFDGDEVCVFYLKIGSDSWVVAGQSMKWIQFWAAVDFFLQKCQG